MHYQIPGQKEKKKRKKKKDIYFLKMDHKQASAAVQHQSFLSD